MILIEFDSLSILLSLSLEIAIAFLCLEFFLLFFHQFSEKKPQKNRALKDNSNSLLCSTKFWKKNSKYFKKINNVLHLLQVRELGWGLMFFLIGNMMIFQIIGDFYLKNENIRLVFIYGRNLEFVLSITLFSYSLESSELKSNRYLFSYGFGLLSVVILIFTLVYSQITLFFLFLVIPLTFILLFQYGLVTYVQTKKFRTFRYPFFGLFLGFFLFIFGFLISQVFFSTSDIPNIDLSGRLVGDLIQMSGIFLLAIAFFFLPSLNEFTWYNYLKKLLVIHQTGLCLFGYEFQTQKTLTKTVTDEDLTTSLLLTINMITQEITASNESKTDVIHTDETSIIFEFGENCTIALFVTEDSITIRKKIREFCLSFEEKYADYLAKWSGNTEYFASAENLIKKIFSPEEI
ncbi:MAG: hypothetical protein ACTSX0_08325 [Promethearchaeota archaeon]